MRTKIFGKSLLLYGLAGLIGFLIISFMGSKVVAGTLLRSHSRTLYYAANSLASEQAGLVLKDETALKNLGSQLRTAAEIGNCKINILDTEGNILVDSEGHFPENKLCVKGFDPIALGSSYYTLDNFFGFYPDTMVTVCLPIHSGMTIRGYATIHQPYSAILQETEDILKQVYLISLIIYGILLAALLATVFLINRPLEKITAGVQEFSAGNFSHQIQVSSQDEMGYLANTLNYMARELDTANEYQRKFISNVSHDFRSPLTSIKGYAEAILDGTIPHEMQDRYLQIIVNETNRLNKLTKSLLTLNGMDRKNFSLLITDFDVNQMIKDVVATFEGTCTSKRITMELLLEGESLMATGDFDRIQQVLYNLIDNAIKFSHSNSSIEVETRTRHGKIYVSVRDHGIGIPPAYLNKIWNRFYKVDQSRGKDRQGTGLGLSIVKEIINAHDQKIHVVSTKGVGTEFEFSLNPATESADE